MNKFHIIKQLKHNGDSFLLLKDGSTILVTSDFSAPHIKRRRHGRFTIQKNCVLIYSWHDDKFRNIEVINIIGIKPLSSILRNKPPEVLYNG